MSFSIALIGECMIELQEITPGNTQQTFGGDTLNTAIYIARLQKKFPAKVDYVTALGCDPFSDKMINFWEKEGVGSSMVLRQETEMPGLYYIQLDDTGERHFSYWRSEAAVKKCFEYPKSDTILDRLGDYDAIYLSGISIAVLTPTSRDRLFSRLEELAKKGSTIYFDYNYRPHLWQSYSEGKEAYETIVELAHTIFVGLDELQDIHGISNETGGHEYFASKNVKEVIIRSGSQPCSILANDEVTKIAAKNVPQIVDTTAAGDSFSAGYLAARQSGYSVVKAAELAHSMAAYVIRHKGAIAPIDEMPQFDD